METKLDEKETATFKELLISEIIQTEALTRLLIEKGIISQEEYVDMLRRVQAEYDKRQEK
ncbi:hypothetical protein QUF80_05460 [Desulfococcaceae bacterium HSG8]|nr:hypothetical protein [Desulfococcaceae bacterium HSG8]